MRRNVLPAVAISLIAAGPLACKKDKDQKTPQEQAPAPLTPEVAISRDYPAATWGTFTVVQPGALLDAMVEQASPGYDWRAKVEGKAPGALAGFDLSAPIDVLAGYVPKTSHGERVVVSFGITDKDKLQKSLEVMEIKAVDQGGNLVIADGKANCELSAGAKRMHCWAGDKAANTEYLAALDARKSEGAPRMQVTLDAEYLRGPLKADVDGGAAMAKVFGPQAFEQLKDAQLREDATALLTDVVDGTVEFLGDLDRVELTIGLQPNNAGVFGRVRVRMDKRDSQMGKWLAPGRLPSGPAPAELLALPGDVDNATYVRADPSMADAANTKILDRFQSLAKGAARELGLPDKELDAVFAAMHVNDKATWTATVTPRLKQADVEAVNVLVSGQQQNVVWFGPSGSHDPIAPFAAIETYIQLPAVQARIDALMAQMPTGAEAPPVPTFSSAPLEGIGIKAHRMTMDWNLGDLGAAAKLPREMHYVFVIVQDEKFTWTGFGSHEAVLMDYIKRAMAGEGPTLGEDPRTAFLKDENAFMAGYTPIDPVYVGEFASELIRDMSEITGELGDGEVNAFREFDQRMPTLVEKWKQLPPSAARSRVVVDDAGVVWEGSMPSTTLRMAGDAGHMVAEVFREQKG